MAATCGNVTGDGVKWKAGFEIELLAPPGGSREVLADRVARRIAGSAHRIFYPQSEPSKVPGKPTFENLTPAFTVRDANGASIATFADDITIQATLDRRVPAKLGWYRIVSDDSRILQLVIQNCDPQAPIVAVLEPLAKMFGTPLERHDAGMSKVSDVRNVSVAIAASMPGERERPCEIITAPLTANHDETLDLLLSEASLAGFTVPLEGATHIHFDGAPLKNARVLATVIEVFWKYGQDFKRLFKSNPNCVRLGNWPRSILKLAESKGFADLEWKDAVEALRELKPSKYCDYNLLNLISDNPLKETFEVRILPSGLAAEPILAAGRFFEAVLAWCVARPPKAGPIPPTLSQLITQVMGNRSDTAMLLERAAQLR